MTYQKIQSNGAYAEFTIKADEIGEAPFPHTRTGQDDWELCLINTTDQDFALAALAREGEGFGAWFKIPVVRNNCPTGYEMCFGQQSWTGILSLPGSHRAFGIRIATRPNAFGIAQGTEFLNIRPQAGMQGGVLGIAIDG